MLGQCCPWHDSVGRPGKESPWVLPEPRLTTVCSLCCRTEAESGTRLWVGLFTVLAKTEERKTLAFLAFPVLEKMKQLSGNVHMKIELEAKLSELL